MQSSQYLILAREINRDDNGIFSFLDICQHLAVKELPAKGVFDMAIICGPGWEKGDYRIHIGSRLGDKETKKIGYADIKIIDEAHIYTAVVKKLNLVVDNNEGFTFEVYKESGDLKNPEESKEELLGEMILERPFRVNVLQPVKTPKV